MKKIIFLSWILLLLSSCKIDDIAAVNETDKSLKIGVLIYNGEDVYINSVKEEIKNLSHGYENLELTFYDSKSDQGLQFEQVDDLIKHEVDCLAINLVDTPSFKRMAEKLLEADMPAVFFNRQPDLVLMKSYKNLFFVGTNLNEAGILQGELIVDKWKSADYDRNNDGIMQYILLQGDVDNAESIARSEQALGCIKSAGIETEELLSQAFSWDEQKAETALTANPKVLKSAEIIISNNDTMAIGALKALENNDFDLVPIFGVDAIEEAKILIEDGKLAGTVKQDNAAMAENILKACINGGYERNFLDGLDLQADETGVAIRIPYKPYKKSQ